MELTRKQEEGLKLAVERYKNKEKYTVIAGQAGAGKSTLVKFIIDALPVNKNNVCFATFTGKAAQVLLKKGNKNVKTLHKLLYQSFPKATGGFYHRPVEFIPYDVVVVDEVSMAPKTLMDLLFSYDVYVICLGDPFQLPPVSKDEDNHLLDNPHIFLDEIMRQAQESEIIRLTMAIRNGTDFKSSGEEVQIFKKEDLSTGMLMWADQVIVGTNATRISINNQMRNLLGRGEMPEDGDKIICLRNYWETLSDFSFNPLVNGTIGTLQNSYSSFFKLPRQLKNKKVDIICGSFVSDNNDEYANLNMDKNLILKGENSLDWKESFILGKNPETKKLIPMEFTYGYAITCHKSQGSAWDKVLVIEERFPFDKQEHARWLYTACTRAVEKLVLIK